MISERQEGPGSGTFLTSEHNMNYVLFLFRERAMVKVVVQEAAALASLALFVGMIAIWSQVLGNL